MNAKTNETGNLSTNRTAAAIQRLESYLHSIGYGDANVHLETDMIYVEFMKVVQLKEEELKEIQNIFYWTNSISVPVINGLVHLYECRDVLLISVMAYDKISMIHDFIESKGLKILEFDVCNTEICFKYDWSGKDYLKENDLNEIRKVVDPDGTNPKALIIYGRGNHIHYMRIRLK